MALDKVIAAKVSAYHTGWVDPDEFAEFTDKGLIYRQRHHMQRDNIFGFFVIGKGDKVFPIDQLTDLNYADNLCVVLPYDAINSKTLSVLRLIETNRGADKKPNIDKEKNLFEIDVVGDVGKDASTGETRYACNWFGSTNHLIETIRGEIRKKLSKQVKQISRLTDAQIRSVVKNILEPFKKKSVTLNEVDDFVPSAKKYKVPL